MFGSPQDAMFSLAGFEALLRPYKGLHKLAVQFHGFDSSVLVGTWSLDKIGARLNWLTGLTVEHFETWRDRPQPAPKQSEPDGAARERARQAELKKLAALELPTHDCPMRGEILSARKAVGYAK